MDDLKERFAISPLIDAEIDVAGLGLVGLHPEIDHDLRVSITAAVIARYQGYASVDYVRKRYLGETEKFESGDTGLRHLVTEFASAFDRFYRSFPARSDEPIGIFAFDLAFVRSLESVKLLLSTARQGFLIEPCLIARSLMEQFAYAIAVWDAKDDDTVFSTKPQRSLEKLKRVQPSAGRAYGYLSELSHYNPKFHSSFIGKDDGSQVLQRSYKFKITSLAWVFYILDLQFRVFENCYGSHDSFKIVAPLEGKPAAKFDRFFEGTPTEIVSSIRKLI